MNRTEIVAAIARSQQVKAELVDEVLTEFLDLLVLNMAVDEPVTIRGLGRFEPRTRPPVTLRNPHDQTPINVAPRRTMVFKPSMKVKERLNAGPLS